MTISELVISMLVDTKGVDKGMQEAQRKIDMGARSLANSLLAPFRAALGQLAAGLSIGAITKQYIDQADAVGKMAKEIGADVEELQAWGEAADRAGGSTQGFYSSVQNLNRQMQQVALTGKGPAAQAFQRFGIRTKDAADNVRDSFEVLRDLAGIMEGMDKRKALTLGQQIGLDRGTIMLLQSGRIAVDDMIKRMKELGGYTQEDTEIAGKAKNAIKDLGQALKSGATILMAYIVPAITWVTRKLTDVVVFFKRHKPFVLMTAIGLIAAVIMSKLIPALKALGTVSAVALKPYLKMGKILAVILLIAAVLDDLWAYMHGGKSAFANFWKQFGTGPELLEKFNKAKKAVLDFFEAIKPHLGPILKTLGLIAATLGGAKLVASAIKAAKAIKIVGTAIAGVFKLLAKNPIALAIAVLILMIAAIIANWDKIKEKFNEIIDGFSKKWADTKQWFADMWNGFVAEGKKAWESLCKLFEWETWKKEFAKVFDILPDFGKIKQEFINAMKQAWEDIKNFFSFPGFNKNGGGVPNGWLNQPPGHGGFTPQAYDTLPSAAYARPVSYEYKYYDQRRQEQNNYNQGNNPKDIPGPWNQRPQWYPNPARQADTGVHI